MKYKTENFHFKSIKEMPAFDRPREKLDRLGSEALSDGELLMLILSSGTSRVPVTLASERLLELLDHKPVPTAKEIASIPGIGEAKSKTIAAAMEFGRRRLTRISPGVSGPKDIFDEVKHFGDRAQEQFIIVILNGAHEIIQTSTITMGLVNRTLVHPREVFAIPLEKRATAIALAHNHPSGNLTPSDDDVVVTKRLIKCGEILGIKILDHLVFSKTQYFSFLENELIGS